MKDHWFESNLRNRLQSDNNPTELDALWNQIEDKRNKKSKRYALWLIPLFVIILIGTFFLFNQNELGSKVEDQKPAPITSKNINVIQDDRKEAFQQINVKKAEVSIRQIESPEVLNDNSDDNKEIIKKSNQTETKQNISDSKYKLITSDLRNREQSTSVYSTSSYSEIKSQENEKNTVSLFSTPPMGMLNPLSMIPSKKTDWQIIPRKISIHDQFEIDRSLFSKEQIAKERRNWFIDINIGYGTASRTWNTSDLEIYNIRNSNERVLDHFQGQFSIGQYFSDLFWASLGLSYSQYTVKFEGTITNVSTQSTVDTTIIITNPSGQLLGFETGATTLNIAETKSVRYYQQYRSFSIPIKFGVTFDLSEKLNLSLGTGVEYAFRHNVKGRILESIDQKFNFSSSNENAIAQNGFWTGTVQAMLGHHINKSNAIMLIVDSRYDLSNRINPELNWDTKFKAYNFSIGYRRIF